jgi:hypothetical protein
MATTQTFAFQSFCFLGILLFVVGSLMHVRRCTIHGQFAAWCRDHLATKCIPRVRTIGISDVARDMAHDESVILNLAKMGDFERLTDVVLCHLMEKFYDRDASEEYQASHALENFLFDFYVYTRQCKEQGCQVGTIIDYLKSKNDGKSDQVAAILASAVNSTENDISTNTPPPTTKLDHTGKPLPLSRSYDFSASVQVLKPVPALANAFKNLSMDLMGDRSSAVHPEVGMTVKELDDQYQQIVRRPGAF